MARVKYELAQQGISSGAGSSIRKLRPAGAVNRGALGNIRAASISPSAGRVGFTPLTPPRIMEDPVSAAFKGAAGFAHNLQQAAFRFKEREDRLNADAAIMAFESELSKDFYGYEDESGNWQKGYGHTIGKEANDGFRSYRQSLEDKYHSILSQLEPSVREKAMIRMTKDRDRFLQRAAGHNAQQLRVHEDQVRYEQRKTIMARIQNEDYEVWQSGVIEEHLMTYTNPKERDQALSVLGTQTVYNAYNKAIAQNDDDPVAAVRAMEQAYQIVAKKLEGTEAGNQLLWNVNNKRKSAEREAKTAQQRKERELQQRLVAETPDFVAGLFKDGNYQTISVAISNLNAAFPDPEDIDKKRQAVVGSLVGALERHALNPEFPTHDGKINGVLDAYENMMANPEIAASLDVVEQVTLYQAAMIDVPEKITRLQDRADKVQLGMYASQMSEALKNGQPIEPMAVDPGMTRENQDLAKQAYSKFEQQRIEGIALQDANYQENAPKVFYSILMDRPFLKREMDALTALWADGKIDNELYGGLVTENARMQDPGYVKPAYRKSNEYKQITGAINEFEKLGGFMGTEKPKRDAEGYAQWMMESEVAKSNARIAFDRAALEAFANKRPFDGQKWFSDYVMQNYNNGKITNPNIWRNINGNLVSGDVAPQVDTSYGVGDFLSDRAGDAGSLFMQLVTGELNREEPTTPVEPELMVSPELEGLQ